jgi:hypothetical protein
MTNGERNRRRRGARKDSRTSGGWPGDTLGEVTDTVMTRKRKWSIALLAVLGIVGAGFYVCFVDRHHVIKRKDGWYLDVSVLLVACPVCSGHVERLEWSGRPIGFPTVIPPGQRSGEPWLNTPVGMFCLFTQPPEWKWYGTGPLDTKDVEEPVLQAEVSRGYYPMPLASGERSHVEPRKRGTPDHWCVISYGDERFWVAPDKMGEVVLGAANEKKAAAPALLDVRPATSSSPR